MNQFYDLIVNKLFSATSEYLSELDWSYIITLIVLMQLLNWAFPNMTIKLFKFNLYVSTSWRTFIFSIALALLFYWLNGGGGKVAFKIYFQSALSAMVLYTLIVGKIVRFLSEHFESVSNFKKNIGPEK